MAKAKKEISKRKTHKRVSVKKSPIRKVQIKRNAVRTKQTGWTWFVQSLFLVLFIYAGYLLWTQPWTQGISLIVLLLLIIFVSKIIRKLKKR